MDSKTAEYYLQDFDIVGFPKMGIEFHFSNTAFSVFGFEIKWYGILIALGMLLAMIYCFRRMKEFGLDGDRAVDAVLAGLIAGLAGARVYYIIFDPDKTLADFFQIRSGGLAIYGGLIGAVLAGGLVARLRKVRLLPLLDVASLGFLIGQCIGRWGNFANKEAFGSATDLPWGMATGSVQRVLGASVSETALLAHPCFLYESIWCLIGFILLHFYSRHRKFDGEVFLMYTAWYGLGRFFIEGLRTDSLYLGLIRVSQLLAGLCFAVSVVLILIIRAHYKHSGEAAVLYRDSEESKELLQEARERMELMQDKEAYQAYRQKQRQEREAAKAEKKAQKESGNRSSAPSDSSITEKTGSLTEASEGKTEEEGNKEEPHGSAD